MGALACLLQEKISKLARLMTAFPKLLSSTPIPIQQAPATLTLGVVLYAVTSWWGPAWDYCGMGGKVKHGPRSRTSTLMLLSSNAGFQFPPMGTSRVFDLPEPPMDAMYLTHVELPAPAFMQPDPNQPVTELFHTHLDHLWSQMQKSNCNKSSSSSANMSHHPLFEVSKRSKITITHQKFLKT